ncbi:MAG: hypothetical protein ACYTBJ_20000 [Planctomycetota bacterium]
MQKILPRDHNSLDFTSIRRYNYDELFSLKGVYGHVSRWMLLGGEAGAVVERAGSTGKADSLKMKARNRQWRLEFVSTMVCLCLVVSNSEMVFLCIGEDGHVAIEAAVSNCCGDFSGRVCEEGAISPDAIVMCGREDGCGPCLDVPWLNFAGAGDTVQRVGPSFSVSGTAGILTARSPDFSKSQPAIESYIPEPYFAPLGSVILLT